MAYIKTAISLPESLFEQVDALARELQIPQSRLFTLAVEEYIQHHQNRRLLEAINTAYDDLPDPEEQALLHKIRSQHRRLLEGKIGTLSRKRVRQILDGIRLLTKPCDVDE